MIEIKGNDNIKGCKFLEIDDNIFKNEIKERYLKKSIYLLHYPLGENVQYSVGTINVLFEDEYNIGHLCSSEKGSSGGPIINFVNYKVIGLHKGSKITGNYNLGTLIKKPIDAFTNHFKEDDFIIIYFLYNGIKNYFKIKKDDIIEEACIQFTSLFKLDIEKLLFLYNGININCKLSFNEIANFLDKEANKMTIFVYNTGMDKGENKKEKKKKIKILCDQCKNSNNAFFKCVTCLKNVCSKCREKHDKSHTIYDYDKVIYINFILNNKKLILRFKEMKNLKKYLKISHFK